MSDGSVSISNWNACYDTNDGIFSLSCRITADEGQATISGVGLILNDGGGKTIASMYVELAEESSLASPALNVPGNGFSIGDPVIAAASGEAEGKHFFFEEKLTIEGC